ncbi:hypothetical protein SPHINGOT1_80166 [Sphingomonas sp. T1]|nr:hypothetical protein SPHINGOT1_80166 [Sphingomonas sp. T1]
MLAIIERATLIAQRLTPLGLANLHSTQALPFGLHCRLPDALSFLSRLCGAHSLDGCGRLPLGFLQASHGAVCYLRVTSPVPENRKRRVRGDVGACHLSQRLNVPCPGEYERRQDRSINLDHRPRAVGAPLHPRLSAP